jgi:ubiquinone/menaquinone biosynthesis C-methylase UbiE
MSIGTGGQQTDVQRQFGPIAANYATSPIHASGPDLAELVKAAALSGSERVLDLGCGAGHTALAVAPHVAEVIAIDLTDEMLATAAGLAAARDVANVNFRRADVAALPFEDASFDVVTSRYSAHHYDQPARAVAEARRVLRPGGRFVLVDTIAPESPALDTFINGAELLRDTSHVRNWRLSEWRGLIEAAGFAVDVPFEMTIDLDGPSWVARSHTPAGLVAALRTLFAAAPAPARAAFDVRAGDGDDWGWRIPVALVRGRLP